MGGCVDGCCLKMQKGSLWALPQFDQHLGQRDVFGKRRFLPDSVQGFALNPHLTTASKTIWYVGLTTE